MMFFSEQFFYSEKYGNDAYFSKMKCVNFDWMGLNPGSSQGIISSWTTEYMTKNSETNQNLSQTQFDYQNFNFQKINEKTLGFEWPSGNITDKKLKFYELFIGDIIGWTYQNPGKADLCEVSIKVDLQTLTTKIIAQIDKLKKSNQTISFTKDTPEWKRIVRNKELTVFSSDYQFELPEKYYWPVLLRLYDGISNTMSNNEGGLDTTVTFNSMELL